VPFAGGITVSLRSHSVLERVLLSPSLVSGVAIRIFRVTPPTLSPVQMSLLHQLLCRPPLLLQFFLFLLFSSHLISSNSTDSTSHSHSHSHNRSHNRLHIHIHIHIHNIFANKSEERGKKDPQRSQNQAHMHIYISQINLVVTGLGLPTGLGHGRRRLPASRACPATATPSLRAGRPRRLPPPTAPANLRTG
jgi:hypothetical protein